MLENGRMVDEPAIWMVSRAMAGVLIASAEVMTKVVSGLVIAIISILSGAKNRACPDIDAAAVSMGIVTNV
jgi:hypothetical protein